MCKALKEIVKDTESQGVRQGVKQGVKQGENLLGTLIDRFLADEEIEDARSTAADEWRIMSSTGTIGCLQSAFRFAQRHKI